MIINRNFVTYTPSSHDEDAEPYADNRLAVICDGLGASGQNKHTYKDETRTSAAIGSRLVSKFFKRYFSDHYADVFPSDFNSVQIAIIMKDFKDNLSLYLSEMVEKFKFTSTIKGKSIQLLPTTLAAMVYKQFENNVGVLVISSGDSRVYCFTAENGLQQLSIDDVDDDKDAFQKATNMTNNISQNREYFIHYNYYILPKDCIIFAASDGCFDYLPNPIEYEFMMCCAVANYKDDCENFQDGENWLGDSLKIEFEKKNLKAHDDCTTAGYIFGYDDCDIRSLFRERGAYIAEKYIKPIRKIENESKIIQNHKGRIKSFHDDLDKLYDSQKQIIRNEFIDSIKRDVITNSNFDRNNYSKFLYYKTHYFEYKNQYSEELNTQKTNLEKQQAVYYQESLESFKQVFIDYKYREAIMPKKLNGTSKIFRVDETEVNSLYNRDAKCMKTFHELFAIIKGFLECNIEDFDVEKFKSIFTSKYNDCTETFDYLLNRSKIKEKIENDIKLSITQKTDFRKEFELFSNSQNHLKSLEKSQYFSKFKENLIKLDKVKQELKNLQDQFDNTIINKCINQIINNDFTDIWNQLLCDDESISMLLDPKINKKIQKTQQEIDNLEALIKNEFHSESKLDYWEKYRQDYELFKYCELKGVVE